MLSFEEWIEMAAYYTIKDKFLLARQGMIPVPDASGFEDWNSDYVKSCEMVIFGSDTRSHGWQAALAWAESSGRYIRVPDASEWPINADRFVAYYSGADGYTLGVKPVESIPRPTPPKPVWEPKVGELVLARTSGLPWGAGKYRFSTGSGFHIVDGVGLCTLIAPFDPAKIGEVEQ
jgi:hypothetical protein